MSPGSLTLPRAGLTLWAGVLLTLVIPPVVFLAVALTEGMSVGGGLAALGAQYSARIANLLICTLLGFAPIVLLGVVLWVIRRVTRDDRLLPLLALGGLLPILLVAIWIHHDYWSIFLPSQTYPGFPHGLGFILGPVIFAPIAMAAGMLISCLFLGLRG